jgi:Fic family protein
MDMQTFAASPCGRVRHTKTGYDAYVPDPLPVSLEWHNQTVAAVERAALLLGAMSEGLKGEMNGFVTLLQARDAVDGARSEGMRLSLTDYFAAVATDRHDEPAAQLAMNYARVLEYAHHRLEELPLSLRLVREMHELLLDGAANSRATPGHFRTSQNWVGAPGCTLASADYVPPPVAEMWELLDDWERYLHAAAGLPHLAVLALTQYQYLVIHPFLTMNVLTGALVASATLQHLGVAKTCLPMFGRFFERNGHALQQRLLGVCARGGWHEWLAWFLHGLADVTTEALENGHQLGLLREELRLRLNEREATDPARAILELLFNHPALTLDYVAKRTGLAAAEAAHAVAEIESLGLLTRTPTPQGNVYVATDIITALESRPGIEGIAHDRF